MISDTQLILNDLTKDWPHLSCFLGDVAAYKRLRIVEPHLVSCFDAPSHFDCKKVQILTLTTYNGVLGALSFGVFSNEKRKGPLDLYARIDLVIADKSWRGYGVSRALILCAMFYILKTYGKRLYSFSCLAAHQAIAKILESLSFTGEIRTGQSFKHENLNLEDMDCEKYFRDIELQLQVILNDLQKKVLDKIKA